MEKDFFKDRSVETTLIKDIKVGDYVYICLKAMQPYAETLDDLSFGRVTKILTKHDHPRGIKVTIDSYVNPNENRDSSTQVPITDEHYIGFNQVGRVVYKTTNGVIHKK